MHPNQRVADAGDRDRPVLLDEGLGATWLVCPQGAHRNIVYGQRQASCQCRGGRPLLLLLEQILEDEPPPLAAAGVYQRATLVELSQVDGCEAELFGQGRHGSDRVLVVARQEDDAVAALDGRIGGQGGRNQVIEPFDELGAGERLRDEGGGRKAVQLFRGYKRVRRVDDCLAFPARQKPSRPRGAPRTGLPR